MPSASRQTSLFVRAQRIHQRNCYGVSIFSRRTPPYCLPISLRIQERPQAAASSHPQNLGKTIIGVTFQAILALFISTPTSSPPLFTHLFAATVLISFSVSFAALFLHNSFPRTARFFEKTGALSAAIGACIIASLLVQHNYAWLCWLACAFSFIVFLLSFK